MNLFKSLTYRPFALLWSGQTTSRLGDTLYRIALAWWVLQKTGSAAAMGTVLIFSSVPMLIFLLFGGVATDRLPRLKVMWFSDLASGAVVAWVALFSLTGWLEVWHIYIASIILSLVQAFFSPAYSATVPEITPPELLPSANSMTSLGQRGASILGPSIGAVIIAAGGTSLAFGLDALSFFISAACVLPILRMSPPHPAAAPAPQGAPEPARRGLGSVIADIGEGLKTVLAYPWLWITIVVFGLVNAANSGPMAVSLPFLVEKNLKAGVETLGLFSSAISVGYLVGAIWLGRFSRLRRRGWMAYTATVGIGLFTAAFGLTTWLPLLVAAAFAEGFVISIFGLIWINSLQELVPRRLLGRVSSIDALGSYVLMPVGFGIAGWATDLAGAPPVFVIGGAITCLLAVTALLHPAIRGLD